PVGSQQLARRSDFDVSSATLRNVMADLEALGYLEKPHTSAGRVPTDSGYRFYIDTLLKLRDPAPGDRERIEQGIPREDVEGTFAEASRVLHALTQHAGVVLRPQVSSLKLRRLEFLRLRDNRLLAVLVGDNGQVQNKAISVDFDVSAEDLVRASNYLSELLQQLPLEGIRGRLMAEMEQDRAQVDAVTAKALKMGVAATELQRRPQPVLIEGTGSLLDSPEFADVERVRSLVRSLDEKNKLIELLDRVLRAGELQIFIGAESEFSSAGEVSVIASPYGTQDRVFGAVGVIGPTRMDYQRVIPLVNFTAQVLSRVLESS
ncbi:MAG TPA: heat-inducible transcriptional repressor HrcA, partial [Myxococcaceae bacterium]|nr:heat-inducible transcriptional repressor HrcA [Myxococcaceae bacterium]